MMFVCGFFVSLFCGYLSSVFRSFLLRQSMNQPTIAFLFSLSSYLSIYQSLRSPVDQKEQDLALKANHVVKQNDHVHQARLKQAQNGEYIHTYPHTGSQAPPPPGCVLAAAESGDGTERNGNTNLFIDFITPLNRENTPGRSD